MLQAGHLAKTNPRKKKYISQMSPESPDCCEDPLRQNAHLRNSAQRNREGLFDSCPFSPSRCCVALSSNCGWFHGAFPPDGWQFCKKLLTTTWHSTSLSIPMGKESKGKKMEKTREHDKEFGWKLEASGDQYKICNLESAMSQSPERCPSVAVLYIKNDTS